MMARDKQEGLAMRKLNGFIAELLGPLLACAMLASSALVAHSTPVDRLPIRIGWQPSGEFRFFVAKQLNLFEQAGLDPQHQIRGGAAHACGTQIRRH